jgi:hypothetical protein
MVELYRLKNREFWWKIELTTRITYINHSLIKHIILTKQFLTHVTVRIPLRNATPDEDVEFYEQRSSGRDQV